MSGEKTYWVGLESNPEVLTKFAYRLGLPQAVFQFSDCFGLDDELLAFVPQPCHAVVFLYPSSQMATLKKEQAEKIKAQGQHVSEKVWFMRQLVGNACGTVALVHALANNRDKLSLEGGFFKDFVDANLTTDAHKRGELFGTLEGLKNAHESMATEGQTAAPEADAALDFHFICFVEVDGHLYELDGAKEFPVNHGECASDRVLHQAAKVIQSNYIQILGQDQMFSVITLGPPPSM
eukprot:GFYU01000718.1.p1 GENE.GFYU01000718.1~~GFYU01000718.1.p1  ORF type:complete len:236 (+),score=74.66 GFYU01000718.1:76-783(+)